MKSIIIKISKLIVLLSVALVVSSSFASSDQKPLPAAKFYPFDGKWQGIAELAEPGHDPVKLDMTLSCHKASSGWAIACDMNAKNDNMMISESDLMGVDPQTGKGHWYAVTSMGETHDHQAEWADAHTMKAHYAWNQEGKKMEEKVVFNFKTKKSVSFRSVVSVDGKVAGEFSGTLTK